MDFLKQVCRMHCESHGPILKCAEGVYKESGGLSRDAMQTTCQVQAFHLPKAGDQRLH